MDDALSRDGAVVAAATVPSRRALVTIWVLSAMALGAVIVAGTALRTDGDDRDPARQRPGILDLGDLPQPAPRVTGLDLPAGQRSVVFFAAQARVDELCRALREHDALGDEAVLIAAPLPRDRCAPNASVATVDVARAAHAFGLPAPRGDVAPTGYAIVDRAGLVRYRTLDPVAASLLGEVATMLRGVQ